MLRISTAELAADANRYIAMLPNQDIMITRNEEPVARLVSVMRDRPLEASKEERIAAAKALFGLLSPNIDLDKAREERLS